MKEGESLSRHDRAVAAMAAYLQAVDRDEKPDRETFLKQHADIAVELELFLDNEAQFREHPAPHPFAPTARFHGLGDANPAAGAAPQSEIPDRIGRYRIEKVLGKGGFGIVYLAQDQQLNRPVAVKVPHRKLVTRPEDAEAYLTEARTVASLDHPYIVPVFDVGSTEQFPCYVVSKYIDGTDLASRLSQSRLNRHEAVELVATVSEALHHAHKHGLVHRDVKPGNLLLDRNGQPFVADFGLALREQDAGKGPRYAGTPAYMSPEQARGEGHRVDGRSDIFSLGIVFYELLTGRRPFKADSRVELLEQIISVEARPPRQVDDAIPKELERICLKSLSKRASERYTTARDLAEDLSLFLSDFPSSGKWPVTDQRNKADIMTAVPIPTTSQGGESIPIKIVPKGLRSFDAHDADFFLELLPGTRDRDGLPDSIRFWKTRIEEKDGDATFAVGLIYGPSGCGKSSLVKAGLLPRLSDDVVVVYIEASAEETETRLLNGLRKRRPAIPDNLPLKETLAALRRGQGNSGGKKVVIVLDQFEQWLHAKKDEPNTELVQALRQCDGGRLQCIVMVRDDFWMAATRFMRELEIRLVEAQNSAAVDLFDLCHARKVLTAFGRAFGDLPENGIEQNKDQNEFLNLVVSGLAQEGKVISVRLALFAEMMKRKAWTPAALKKVGGTAGIGIAFLEGTFGASTAPPEHRYHQKAARAVLKALLPESGTDIKGHMRSYTELLEASGYGGRPKDFGDLIQILDSEVRLITPTDPDGTSVAHESTSSTSQLGQRYYQLTHDYLVHPLRDWLTSKQKETSRGRAELLLADRASVWNARPENRQLPSLSQWFQITWSTVKKNWTPPQRRMMATAGKYHVVRATLIAALLFVVAFTGLTTWRHVDDRENATHAAGLVNALLNAETAQVATIIERMAPYHRWVDPLLKEANGKAAIQSRQKLVTSLALLPDVTQAEYLSGRLLQAEPEEIQVIRDALVFYKDKLTGRLWEVLVPPTDGREQQVLCAAAALAKYAPNDERWDAFRDDIAERLAGVNAFFIKYWIEALRPIKDRVVPRLSQICQDWGRDDSQRHLVAQILADYAADQPKVLADLVMGADEKQFAAIFPKLKDRYEQGLPMLIAAIDQTLPSDGNDDITEKLAKRKANAAVAMIKLDRPDKVWNLLKHSPDPRVRSYLVHRLGPLGAPPKTIINRFEDEKDITIRRALILTLGEYGHQTLSDDDRQDLIPKLKEMYRDHPDPGLHAASEWLLRQWQQETWLNQVNEEWAKDKPQRDQRLEGIQEQLANRAASASGHWPQWYVNGQGQTLVVIVGPVEFEMGSPPTEFGRADNELRHKRWISRSFAIANKSTTLEQYREFDHDYKLPEVFTRTADLPVVATSWYQATAYCNWLSKKEGFPEVYEIAGDETKLKANYLSLPGYRLPTEAEMEYATRAGAATAQYYGETDELLRKYAWYQSNSRGRIWPVGCLKPNDFGLFDMHGNCYTWCQEQFDAYPEASGDAAVDDKEGKLEVDNTKYRVLRGGSFFFQSRSTRSASRTNDLPTIRDSFIGFRLARTLLAVAPTTLPLTSEEGAVEKTDK